MASTVMAVLDSAGAWVTLMIAQFATMKRAPTTISGKTTPIPTTTNQEGLSPGCGPAVSEPKPRRSRRTQATTSRPVISARPPRETAVITQKRSAMSVPGCLCGSSVSCGPPQPASTVGASSAAAANPLRHFVPRVAKSENGYPSLCTEKPRRPDDRLELRSARDLVARARRGALLAAGEDARATGAAGAARTARRVRRGAANGLRRTRVADRPDRGGAALLGAHAATPAARRRRGAAARARARREAAATTAAGAALPPVAGARASPRRAAALGGELRRLASARPVRRGPAQRRDPRAP